MSTKRHLLINTGSQMIGKVVTSGTTFIISILIARSLGADGYGDFSKITTYIPIFYLFADFGLNAAYIQKEQEDKKSYLPTLFSIRILGSITLMSIAALITLFLPSTNGQGYTDAVKLGILLFSPTILFQSLITSTNAVFQKKGVYQKATFALIIGSLTTIALLLITNFYMSPLSVIHIIAIVELGLAATAISALWCMKTYEKIKLHFDKKMVLDMIKHATPLGLTLMINTIYFRADAVIMAMTRSTVEVGQYGLAYKMFEVPLSLPTFVMNALFPALVLLQSTNNHKQLKVQIEKTLKSMGIIGAAIAILCWIGSPLVAYISEDFAKSIIPLRILILSLPIYYLTGVTMWGLITVKKQKSLLTIYGTAMLLNIGANLIFVPLYGFVAAAIITGASEAYILITSLFILRKSLSSPLSLRGTK